MVAVPANAASRQRWLTLEAFRARRVRADRPAQRADRRGGRVRAPPPAELGKKSPKRYVVVYDLGGGTFDTSAVSLEGRRFDLIASEGIARLGGDDFDELILDGVAGVAPTAAALERAREAKETLRPTTRKLLLDLGRRRGPSRSTSRSSTRARSR